MIFLKESGWEHVVDRHFSPGINAGQFTISQKEVKALLQSKQVVNSSVRVSELSGQFIREVDIGRTIGTVKPSLGGQTTSNLIVITNRTGNLVSTYPIP